MNDNVHHTIQRDECIGSQLKYLRTFHDITVEHASHSIGKSKSFLSLVENGKRTIKIDALIPLLQLYRFRLSEFFFTLAEQYPFSQYGITDERHKRIFITGDEQHRPLLTLKMPDNNSDIIVFDLFLEPNSQLTETPFAFGTTLDVVSLEGKLLIQLQGDELVCKSGHHTTFDARQSSILRNYESISHHSIIIAKKNEL